MSAPYESHIISSVSGIRRDRSIYINLLSKLICLIALLSASTGSFALPTPIYSMDLTDATKAPAVDTVTVPMEMMADSTEVHFRQSGYNLDLGLDGNGERLAALLRQMKIMSGQDSTYVLSTLRVIGSASPEGSEATNRRLSEQRAHTLFDYIAKHVTLPDSITDFEYLGRNWRGLYHLVATDRKVPAQTEVLALLRRAMTGPALTSAESNRLLYRLKRLKAGVPYAYMYRHLFPALRYSYLYVQYEKRVHREIERLVLQTIEAEETSTASDYTSTTTETSDTGPLPDSRPAEVEMQAAMTSELNGTSQQEHRNFYMDFRTNMLLDIAAVPNLGVEFYLGNNISISADWMYSWWSYDRRHRYWRLYGGDLGLRWWFGHKAHTKPLTGHHLGIYGGVLTFDFELGDTGYMGGQPGGTLWDRCLVNAGIEYGYSVPIGSRLNIDFSIGLGYLGGRYIKYFPFDNDYYRDKEYNLHFFGPTKAEISLVWLLGRGNSNKKGGER